MGVRQHCNPYVIVYAYDKDHCQLPRNSKFEIHTTEVHESTASADFCHFELSKEYQDSDNHFEFRVMNQRTRGANLVGTKTLSFDELLASEDCEFKLDNARCQQRAIDIKNNSRDSILFTPCHGGKLRVSSGRMELCLKIELHTDIST